MTALLVLLFAVASVVGGSDLVSGGLSRRSAGVRLLCLGTWVTVLCQDMGDTSVGSGGDTCGLRLGGEL